MPCLSNQWIGKRLCLKSSLVQMLLLGSIDIGFKPYLLPSWTFVLLKNLAIKLNTVVPCSYATPSYAIFAATLF